MLHLVSKSGFALIICAAFSVALSGCGRKPGLSDLKPKGARSEAVASAAPPNVETLDGRTDKVERVATEKPERGFILDPLL